MKDFPKDFAIKRVYYFIYDYHYSWTSFLAQFSHLTGPTMASKKLRYICVGNLANWVWHTNVDGECEAFPILEL